MSDQPMTLTRRVGLLGGTFDPVHLGHLVVAEHLRLRFELDEVRLLVAGAPWMKSPVTAAADRLAMAAAAVEGVVGLAVDDTECRRDGPTYTADTLEQLHEREPHTEWFFCLGSDAAAGLHSWERIERVFELATVVVVPRPGGGGTMAADLAARVVTLDVPALDISSSDLRARVASSAPVRFLVPLAVHRQIVERGLYRATHE